MILGSFRRPALTSACLLLWSGGGCDKASQVPRHMERGDKYFKQGKFNEAVIEYSNVLQLDAKSSEASRKLGLAAFEAGQMGPALAFLHRSFEQDPGDLDVRLKLGTALMLSRQFDKAREHARYVLSKSPDDSLAAGLLAECARTAGEIDEAIALLTEGQHRFERPDLVQRALGELFARKGDIPSTERVLRASISALPGAPDAHFTLAMLHFSKRKLEEAERELRAAADLSPPGSRYQLELADFLLGAGKNSAARAVLERMLEKVPDSYPVQIRQADLALREGRLDDCWKALEAILKVQPDDPAALVFRAQVQLARGAVQQALETIKRAVKLDAQVPIGHYVLAQAQLQAGNLHLARSAASEAVKLAPGFGDAVLLAADLALRAEDSQAAIESLRAYGEKFPKDPRAPLLLGRVFLQAKDVPRAVESLEAFARMAPSDPRGPFLLGVAARSQGKAAMARQHFEQALAQSPAYVEPLAQLVDMSVRDKRPAQAIERARKQAALAPKSGEVAFVLARAYLSSGLSGQAERELLRALELNPQMTEAYAQLASLYGQAKNYGYAQQTLDKALAENPDDTLMLLLSASTAEAEGNVAKARAVYERILAKQPQSVVAANNLAFLLAEEGKHLERAQELAHTARAGAPTDPNVADTFGWVLFKQGSYRGAVTLFKESLERAPDNADVLVHLALAQAKSGDRPAARESLEKALALNPEAPKAAEALAAVGSK